MLFRSESDADGNAPDGFPNTVGAFLDAMAHRRPELDIYLLKWSGGALIAPGLLPVGSKDTQRRSRSRF